MKRFLLPLIVFLSLPFNSLESAEINCNSPVWKKRDVCKGKVSTKTTYVYWGREYESLDEIKEDVTQRETFEYKGKKYISSTECQEGTNMIWYYQTRFLRSTKVLEAGCLTPDKAKIFALEMQLKNARRGGGGGGGSYRNHYVEGWNQQQQLYQSIDNFHNTGSFYPQPSFGF